MEVLINFMLDPYMVGGLILGVLGIYIIKGGTFLPPPDPDKRKKS